MKAFKIASFLLTTFVINKAYAIGGGAEPYGSIVALNFLTESAETMDAKQFAFYTTFYDTKFYDQSTNFDELPGLYLYYGITNDFNAYFVQRFAQDKSPGSTHYGYGDTDLGIEYRFYHFDSDDQDLHFSFFPIVTVPTGNENLGLGNGTMWSQWPIWGLTRYKDWTFYAGGGYAFNYAKDASNFPFGGFAVQKDFLKQKIGISGELWSQGSTGLDAPGYTLLDTNFGYNITPNFAVVLTYGHSVAGAHNEILYAALYWEGSL